MIWLSCYGKTSGLSELDSQKYQSRLYRVAACFWLYCLCGYNKEQGRTTPRYSDSTTTLHIIILFLIVQWIDNTAPASTPKDYFQWVKASVTKGH